MKKLPHKIGFLIIILLLVALVIFLEHLDFFDFFYYLTSPIQKGSQLVVRKIANFFEVIISIKDLANENTQLKKTNQELLVENTRLREIDVENQILREQLGVREEKEFKLLLASVIGRNRVLIIDKGKRNGIRKGMPIIVAKGLLVGQIIETMSTSSKVLLISDSDSQIKALVQESRATGLVKGEYGLTLTMEMIPQDKEIEPGQLVITSGLNGQFPKGLVIGKITEIQKSPNQVFQKATLLPVAPIRDLELVFVCVSC